MERGEPQPSQRWAPACCVSDRVSERPPWPRTLSAPADRSTRAPQTPPGSTRPSRPQTMLARMSTRRPGPLPPTRRPGPQPTSRTTLPRRPTMLRAGSSLQRNPLADCMLRGSVRLHRAGFGPGSGADSICSTQRAPTRAGWSSCSRVLRSWCGVGRFGDHRAWCESSYHSHTRQFIPDF